MSSQHSSLFTRFKVLGGSSTLPYSVVTTFFGPIAPMCNHAEEEPGPPLNTNVTGRLRTSVTSFLVYAI